MIIKVQTWLYVDVENREQGEEACQALTQLDTVLNRAVTFPVGDLIDTDVSHFEEVSPQEIAERGLEEDAPEGEPA